MRRFRLIALSALVAAGGLVAMPGPALACGSEPGDPGCTVGSVVNATTCTATSVVKGGGKIDKGEIADCFTQTTRSEAVESNITDKVECMFRVYIQEGGESGLDCLT